MLNTLAQFVALSLFWGNPLKINRKFALLLNFHFNHGALTHVDVFTEVINSYTNNTRVFTFYPTKFVTVKRRGDLTWKSSWNRRQFFCVTIVIGVGVVKQNLSCNYIFFSSLLQGKHPRLHGNHLFSRIMILMVFFLNAVCI